MKQKGVKIAALTAYDASVAGILSESGMDVVLVGDSLGMVKLGYESTLPVTLEEMLHHVKAVKRGISGPLLVADMPYLSYEIELKEALKNAGRLVKEGGAQAVKIEGGIDGIPLVKELLKIHIPVMGHLGLTPQSVNRLGGYKVQGRKPQEAKKILAAAIALEVAGVFAVVLECVPAKLARDITKKLSIPTIGIGAGPHCDGQILVSDDLWGMSNGPALKFVKRYAHLRETMLQAARDYSQEVRKGQFPTAEHSFLSGF
jgi:3-methyl-2-oxobutanoate hydroxymethyltransferase